MRALCCATGRQTTADLVWLSLFRRGTQWQFFVFWPALSRLFLTNCSQRLALSCYRWWSNFTHLNWRQSPRLSLWHWSWKHEYQWKYDCYAVEKKEESVQYECYCAPFSHYLHIVSFLILLLFKFHFHPLNTFANVLDLFLKSQEQGMVTGWFLKQSLGWRFVVLSIIVAVIVQRNKFGSFRRHAIAHVLVLHCAFGFHSVVVTVALSSVPQRSQTANAQHSGKNVDCCLPIKLSICIGLCSEIRVTWITRLENQEKQVESFS